MPVKTCDFLVIGGGIIGLNLAIVAKQRYPRQRVVLFEKEKSCGLHASGRNSGVLHAGFYYTHDSLKARFTREGNREMSDYCRERGLRMNRCGKLVVARNEQELSTLEELLNRGRRNGVELQELSADEAREIEPRARTFRKALFSPTTSSVDPSEVMQSMARDARSLGVEFETDMAYRRRGTDGMIHASRGRMTAGYVINAAGLHADTIARDFGFSRNHRILPFKGLYLYSSENSGSIRTNIYPVPDLRNPFLGVHFTVAVDGRVKIGPTAVPAFWRENYGGFANFSLREMIEVVGLEFGLFWRNESDFRRLARHELSKQFRTEMVKLASELASGVAVSDFRRWGKPGIRAQLYDQKAGRLEMDFRYEGDDKSFHVLNAVSPAFTCSLPFSRYLFDQIEHKMSGARGLGSNRDGHAADASIAERSVAIPERQTGGNETA
jgi:L-2-hydroxyglutarate oxidase LhgO